jgi:hypothetical protein
MTELGQLFLLQFISVDSIELLLLKGERNIRIRINIILALFITFLIITRHNSLLGWLGNILLLLLYIYKLLYLI